MNTFGFYAKTLDHQNISLSNIMSYQGQRNINQDICGIDCNLKLVH